MKYIISALVNLIIGIIMFIPSVLFLPSWIISFSFVGLIFAVLFIISIFNLIISIRLLSLYSKVRRGGYDILLSKLNKLKKLNISLNLLSVGIILFIFFGLQMFQNSF